jgi:hypothetical protein
VIPLPVFLVNDKNRTDLNFSHFFCELFVNFFCELGLKMLGPQQWQLLHVESTFFVNFLNLLHVEKYDLVIRHNNNKT